MDPEFFALIRIRLFRWFRNFLWKMFVLLEFGFCWKMVKFGLFVKEVFFQIHFGSGAAQSGKIFSGSRSGLKFRIWPNPDLQHWSNVESCVPVLFYVMWKFCSRWYKEERDPDYKVRYRLFCFTMMLLQIDISFAEQGLRSGSFWPIIIWFAASGSYFECEFHSFIRDPGKTSRIRNTSILVQLKKAIFRMKRSQLRNC